MRPLSSEILQTVALLFLYALGINWSSQDCDTIHTANEKSTLPSQTTTQNFVDCWTGKSAGLIALENAAGRTHRSRTQSRLSDLDVTKIQCGRWRGKARRANGAAL
jgi:hypothetical protein